AVRHRGRRRPAARWVRVRDPRDRRGPPESRDRAELPPREDAQDRRSPGTRLKAPPSHADGPLERPVRISPTKELHLSTHASTSSLQYKHSASHALAGVAAVLLGILVAVLGLFALFTWLDARSARDAADRAAAKAATAAPAASADMGALKSYADAAPANADALAAA